MNDEKPGFGGGSGQPEHWPDPAAEPRTAAGHTHDLRIGAREYGTEDRQTVTAWQVYCTICDEAGRIAIEAEAAQPTPVAADLRAALEQFLNTRYPNNGEGAVARLTWTIPEPAFGELRAALAAQPAAPSVAPDPIGPVRITSANCRAGDHDDCLGMVEQDVAELGITDCLCSCHAPGEPPALAGLDARDFARWFLTQPMQRQIAFIEEWQRQNPNLAAALAAQDDS
jgi:hypothetical protein